VGKIREIVQSVTDSQKRKVSRGWVHVLAYSGNFAVKGGLVPSVGCCDQGQAEPSENTMKSK
jgi:hypothetical protein